MFDQIRVRVIHATEELIVCPYPLKNLDASTVKKPAMDRLLWDILVITKAKDWKTELLIRESNALMET